MTVARRKFVVFALLASALAFVATIVIALGLDLYLHHRAERSAGLNRWGYRGPVAGRKQAGEVRAVMLGGSTVFGYGVRADESIPALLERDLNAAHGPQKWSVINLGYNTEGAFAFLPNLQQFGYLDFDLVILYEGYNDLLGDLSPNQVTVRQQSPIFRATGYFPILPLWLSEKALMLRTGSVASGYDQSDTRTKFRPSLADRTSASALEAAATVAASLERQFRHVGADPQHAPRAAGTLGCPSPWSSYCESVNRAVQYSTSLGKRVLVVGQPNADADGPPTHASQQQALATMIREHYGSDSRVAYVSMGKRVDLLDTDVSFDRMHLSVDGNKIVAATLVDAVAQLWSAR